MAEPPDDSTQCPQRNSTNLKIVGTRKVRNPRSGPDGPVLARTIAVQCRRCKASWQVTRRVTG